MNKELFDSQHAGPRFRNPSIRDLFLLTVAIAPFVSLFSWLVRGLFSHEASAALEAVFILVQSSVCGIFVAALFWFAEAKKKHGSRFLHPGYWLIAIEGLSAIAQSCPILAFKLFENDINIGGYYTLVLILVGSFSLLSWIAALHGAIKNMGWWKIFFLLLLIPTMLVQLLLSRFLLTPDLYMSATLIFKGAIGFFMLIPVTLDLLGSVRRDWVHWLGVTIAFSMMAIIPVVNYLVFLLTS